MVPVVEQVCVDLAMISDEFSKQVIQMQNTRVIITRQFDTVHVDITGHTTLTINSTHYEKLVSLFKLWARRKKLQECQQQVIDDRIAIVMLRYYTFFDHNAGLQNALTPHAFQFLSCHFGVSMECFASPLNCYYPQFCSAFIDTDGPFGSCGSFFDFYPTSGSFEANPPFTEDIMNRMANHMERLLIATSLPLSFIVFVPNWMNCVPIMRLGESHFTRRALLLSAHRHKYVTGYQHSERRENCISYDAVHETRVVFLQNDAGYSKWTPTQEKIARMIHVFEERINLGTTD
jgi:phosphorylated CTD-interacting factor 1